MKIQQNKKIKNLRRRVLLKKKILCLKLAREGRENDVYDLLSSMSRDNCENNHICPVCVLPDFSIESDDCFMCDCKPFSKFSIQVMKTLCCSKVEKDDDNAKTLLDLYYKYKN